MSSEPTQQRPHSQFSLLKTRRFAPFFVTQFLGAFNDNLFKNALVVLLTIHAASWTTLSPEILTTLAAGIFILPFFLFSATAGQLADKFDKARLARLVKLLEMLIKVMRMKEGSLPYPLDAHELNQYHHTTFSVFRQGKMQHFAHFSRKKRADGAKGRVRSILRNNAKHGIIKPA